MSDFEEFDLPEPQPVALGEDQALDQADIDALFGDVGAPAPQKSGLRAVIESDVINHERLPMLEVVFDRLVRMMSRSPATQNAA